jgi:hypothetical protein
MQCVGGKLLRFPQQLQVLACLVGERSVLLLPKQLIDVGFRDAILQECGAELLRQADED